MLREAFAEEILETAALRERVWRQVRASEKQQNSWWKLPRLRYGFSVAAILVVLCAGLFYFFNKHSQPTIYAGVARDHTEDVIERVPKNGWFDGEPQALNYAREQLGDATIVSALAPADFRLVRTRVCNPAGESFVHLIFDNGARQISFYLQRKRGVLSGNPVEVINNRAFYAEHFENVEVAGFQSAQFTVLVVASLNRAEALNLARGAAERIA